MNSKSLLSLAAALLMNGVVHAAPLISISRPVQISQSGGGPSFTPVFSGDGRFVVFVSLGGNLVTNDDRAPFLDIFRRDLVTHNTVLISANRTERGGGDGNSNFPTVSSDGQLIAFESVAGNLTTNDTNGVSDIFLRDVLSGATTLMSVDSTGSRSGNGPSTTPALSGDGQRVVFESSASDLVAGDANASVDLFVRDLPSGVTTLVSLGASGTAPGNTNSDSPAISGDGRFVAFRSSATNLVAGVTNGLGEIYVRDLQMGVTHWASATVSSLFPAAPESMRCLNPVIAANGTHVVFLALSSTLTTGLLVRYDIGNGALALVASDALTSTVPEVSADGRYITYATSTNLRIVDMDLGTGEFICGDANPAGLGLNACRTPVISGDGSAVAFLGASSTNGPWSVYVHHRGSGSQELISAVTNGIAGEVVPVSLPAVTADGKRVAFESGAETFVPDDFNQTTDVFVRDLDTEQTELVSGRAASLGSGTSARLSGFGRFSVSADGATVAFGSLDNHLVADDANEWIDSFVRDLRLGTIQRLRPVQEQQDPPTAAHIGLNSMLNANGRYVTWIDYAGTGSYLPTPATNLNWMDRQTGETKSVGIGPVDLATGGLNGPALSPDGRAVAFAASPPAASHANIYLLSMTAANATNRLISVNRFGTGGNGDSAGPLFSPDGQWILFGSRATDLTTNAVPGGSAYRLFARQLTGNVTRLISRDASGAVQSLATLGAVVSADSRFVAFTILNSGNFKREIVRHDLLSASANQLVCSDCVNPSISADARLVAYEQREAATSAIQVLLRDMLTGQTEVVAGGSSGTRDASGPLLSHDGRYVVFLSRPRVPEPANSNKVVEIHVRDRWAGTTMVVSRNYVDGGTTSASSQRPVLAANGRTVVFTSHGNDLVPDDYNQNRDLFVLTLGGPDTDGDGIEDDWEMAYFGTLSRDGSGDFDGDGASDGAEFRAGTDPTNTGSILRVLTLRAAADGSRTLLWSAVPGRNYRVQFKDDVSVAAWNELPGMITAAGTTASAFDAVSAGDHQRFYRVLLVDE